MSNLNAEAQVAPVDRLPLEIWRQILWEYMHVDYQLDAHPHIAQDNRFPAAICAVSRQWHERFNPILYHRFDFGHLPTEIKPLWCFLRTLVARPDLANLVREITFFSPRVNVPFDFLERPDVKRHLESLYTPNKDLAQQAMVQARFDHSGLPGGDLMPLATKYLSCDVSLNIDKNYHENLVAVLQALVLAHAPQVTRLSLQTLPNDPFLERILYVAGAFRNNNSVGIAFQNLEVLNVAPNNTRNQYLGSSGVVRNGQTVLSSRRQYQNLPKLKELRLLAGRIDHNAVQDVTAVEKLCLADIHNYRDQIEPLLSLSSELRQLSISSRYEKGPLFHSKFWPFISHLKDKLEYLDFYESPHNYMPNQTRYFHEVDDELSFCPPLAEFTKLRVLKTTPLILYGHNCKVHNTPRKLRSHMPPNLESLGLYTERSAWLSTYIPQLESELEGIVLDAIPRQKLSHIVVDSIDRFPYMKMRTAAEQHNIRCVTPSGAMACGGTETTFADQCLPRNSTDAIKLNLSRNIAAAAMLPKRMQVHSLDGTMKNAYDVRTKRLPPPLFMTPDQKRARLG
ncbi:hypothetical protein BJX64DRAFT_287467 [Aspergillus heterothallicus]